MTFHICINPPYEPLPLFGYRKGEHWIHVLFFKIHFALKIANCEDKP